MIQAQDGNIASLVLGLIAWFLPLISLLVHKKGKTIYLTLFSSVSMVAASLALYYQLVYQSYLVDIEDWSALMDTAAAVVDISEILLMGTVAVNLIAFGFYYKMLRSNKTTTPQ